MSLGSEHTHHHSLLAGVGAGGMAVLVFSIGLLWMVWHRIAGAVGTAVTVMIWAVTAAVIAAAAYGIWFLCLRLRHHHQHPETLFRNVIRAEVVREPRLEEVSHTALPHPDMTALNPQAQQHGWPYRGANQNEVQR